eukprot:TRINITY_DN2245_c0_g1_i3.p1 TRINITY_DN2245_c0_g1~~TRINITY_DN2245_c0_g1_i3.p1  ORF type:complete len:385 (-),score=136.90 TRINITY_DN2245_c0_g1_i3:121-1275(-)
MKRFFGREVVLEGELVKNAEIHVVDGIITEILRDQSPNPSSSDPSLHLSDVIVPGFVDIHTHGVGGNEELLEYWKIPEFTTSRVVKYGTTSIVASITFPKDNPQNIDQVISTLVPRIGVPFPNCAIIDGIHAEGPIVADLGGLVPGEKDMSLEDFTVLVDKMGSALKVMTIAPSMEYPIEYSRMKLLQSKGITVSIGHDRNASEEQILGALRLGTSSDPLHVTHIFNVQGFHHRDMGIANFTVLSEFPDLVEYHGLVEPTIEVVGDLLHVHPLVIQLILKVKNWRNIAFITDSFLEPDASSSVSYGGRELEVSHQSNGCCPRVVLKGTKTIAGSCTTMLSMFQYLIRIFKVPIERAAAMCATNPAQEENWKFLIKATDVALESY